MKDWREIDGWLFEEEAALLAKYGKWSSVTVELGVYKGKSTLAILEGSLELETPPKHFAVDTFDGRETTQIEDTYKEFLQNTRYGNVIPIKMTTEEFSTICPDYIELLFIDADHSYEGVKADFNNYINKVSISGYIIFHDAYGEDGPDSKTIPWPGVHKFCQELQSDPRVKLVESVRRCAVFQRVQ